MSILVSACLAGINCSYGGLNSYNDSIVSLLKKSDLIVVCPEVLGNLPIPRIPCNIHGGDGKDVIAGKARIVGSDGKDYTDPFLEGARKAVDLATKRGVTTAYLKQKSPSCGYGQIYDSSGKELINGGGVLAVLLKQAGIEIVPV